MTERDIYIDKIIKAKESLFESSKQQAIVLSEKIGRPVYTIMLSNDLENFVIGFLKKPDLAIIRQASSISEEKGNFAKNEFILNNCLIKEESNPLIITNEDLWISAVEKINEILPDVFCEIKKN
jgi:hypothetical protein